MFSRYENQRLPVVKVKNYKIAVGVVDLKKHKDHNWLDVQRILFVKNHENDSNALVLVELKRSLTFKDSVRHFFVL